jgi:MFS family permease
VQPSIPIPPEPKVSPLSKAFWTLWSATAVGSFGSGMAGVAFPLLAASLTRDPAQVASLTVAFRLPSLLFSLPIGALIDRLDRKRVMVMGDISRVILALALAGIIWQETLTLWLLYGVAFLLGTTEIFVSNAAFAVLPALVRRDQLERANSRLFSVAYATEQFSGPPLGSLLFAISAALPFLVFGSGMVFAAALLYLIPGSFRVVHEARGKSSLSRDILEGLRFLWQHPLLRSISLAVGAANFFANAVNGIFVLYALEVLGLPEERYGLLLTAAAVGGLLASFVADRISKRLGPGRAIFTMTVLWSVAALVMALTDNPFVAGAMWALSVFCVVVWSIIITAVRQAITPDVLLGRVTGVNRLLGWGTIPLGALFGGMFSGVLGLNAPFYLAAAAYVSIGLIVLPLVNNRTIVAAKEQVLEREG